VSRGSEPDYAADCRSAPRGSVLQIARAAPDSCQRSLCTLELPQGQATLSLHVVAVVVPSQSLIYFECNRLDEKVRKLEAAGIVFDDPPADKRWLWREARLSDPDGNSLCLYHAGENRKHPPWRLEDR